MSLNLIRNKHVWFTRGLLILLAVVMVVGLGFMTDDFGAMMSTPVNSAAEVNGEDVSMVNFYMMRDNVRQQLNPQGDLPPEYENQLNVIALNQLINTKLLAQKAKQLGFKVTNEELDESIRTNPSFQIDGRFVGSELYKTYIEQGLKQDVGEFENTYREELLASKMTRLIEDSAVVTDEKLMNAYIMENERVNLSYIELSIDDTAGSLTVGDEEIKKYYDAHKDEFAAPESRKARYVTLGPETFESGVTVTDDEIGSYYNAYSDEFVTEDGSARPLEEVRGEIESRLKAERGEALKQELLGKLQNPASEPLSVDAIAAEYSAGPVLESGALSAQGNQSGIPPVVTRQVFGSEAGKTVLVPVGASIWAIEVTEVIPARETTFDEAREEAALALKHEKASEAARKKGREIIEKLNAAGRKNLASEAAKLGLELKETGYFSRTESIPGLNAAEIRSAAFELDPGAAVSGRLYSTGDTLYIISFKDKQSVTAEEFQMNREEIRARELENQREEIVRNWLQELRRRAEIKPNTRLFPTEG